MNNDGLLTLHLFAGAGGGIVADMMLGHTPVGAVEIDEYCRKVLKQRQADGWLPKFPVYTDVKEYTGYEVEEVDMVCGGFPCQDISAAGKGAGINGERSGLFYEITRICSVIRPRFIFLENSPAIVARGLDSVLGEISKIGYDAEWLCLSASDVGAYHKRERWWCLCADADRERKLQQKGGERNERRWTGDIREEVSDANGEGLRRAGRCVGLESAESESRHDSKTVPDTEGEGLQVVRSYNGHSEEQSVFTDGCGVFSDAEHAEVERWERSGEKTSTDGAGRNNKNTYPCQ